MAIKGSFFANPSCKNGKSPCSKSRAKTFLVIRFDPKRATDFFE